MTTTNQEPEEDGSSNRIVTFGVIAVAIAVLAWLIFIRDAPTPQPCPPGCVPAPATTPATDSSRMVPR